MQAKCRDCQKREWDDAREAVAMMVKGKDGGEKSDPEADGRCILY